MAPAGPDPLGSDPLEPTRRLLARIEVEAVRRRLHDTLVLWELGYPREAIAQFRVSAELALTRALASARVDAAARRRHEQLLATGQTTKVIEWLYHDAEVLPARIALHLHTLLAWGNYASHHQKKAHRVQPSDLAVLVAVTTDLEAWLAVELDGRRSLFGEGEVAVGGEEAEVAALNAGLRPEVARAFVAAGGVTVHGDAHHLRAPALSLELHWSVPPGGDPAGRAFLGLQSFGLADAARFYGRDELTRRLCAAAAQRTPTLVWGASGSGKTSLLRAGLVPWALAQGVTTLYLSDYRGEALAAMVKVLKVWPAKSPLLVVLDQLERALLADCPAEVRAGVVDAVVRLGRWPHLALCVALREEYLGRLLREADAGDAAEGAWVRDRRRFVPVGPLAPAAAREALERPLAGSGVALDPAFLDEVLLRDLGDGEGMAPVHVQLLGETLLAEARAAGATAIDRRLCERLGGVTRILEHYLDRALARAGYDADRELARTLLKAMAGGEARQWLDRGALWQALRRAGRSVDEVQLEALLRRLIDDRLVASRSTGPAAAVEYSLMHEALAAALRGWRSQLELEVEQAQALLDRALDPAAGPAGSEVLRGRALRLVERHLAHLTPPDRARAAALLAASRRARRARYGGLGLLVTLALVGLVFGGQQLRRAMRERERATAAADLGTLLRARLALNQDPSLAVAWLRHLPEDGAGLGLGSLLDEARRRGVARVVGGHGDLVRSVAFAPDGRRLATAGRDGTIRQWALPGARPLGAPLTAHAAYVTSAVYSPDGRLLASASRDGTVRLWDAATGRPRGQPLAGHTHWVEQVVFSPDGRLLASAGFDGTIRLWDVASGQPRGVLTGHEKGVMAVAFARAGALLASGSVDGTVRLWDVAARQPRGAPLRGHAGPVYAVAFTPDGGRLASGSRDSTVRVWDVATQAPVGAPLRGHTGMVLAVAFAPDGATLASAGEDKVIVLWQLATGAVSGLPLRGHMGAVAALAYSPDGRVLASGSTDATARLWDLASRETSRQQLIAHPQVVQAVAYSPDGALLATGCSDGAVRLWDAVTLGPVAAHEDAHDDAVAAVAFAPDGRLFASVSRDGRLRLWTRTGAAGPTVQAATALHAVAFAPDGRSVLVGGGDGAIRRYGAPALEPLAPAVAAHERGVFALACAPDGETLASGGRDGALRLWRAPTLEPLGAPLSAHDDAVHGLAFSPDGRVLASAGGDATVGLWDVSARGPAAPPLRGHQHWALSVAFSPDGQVLASGGSDGTVRLWHVRRGAALGPPLYGHADWVHAVAFAPSGRTLASASGDKTVRLWPIAPAAPVELRRQLDELTNLRVSVDGRLELGAMPQR